MRRGRLATVLTLAIFALILGGNSVAQGPPQAMPVGIEVLGVRQFTPTATVLGTTEPKRRSLVAAAIEGYVVEFPIDEGQRVKTGDVLARLRDNIAQLRLEESRAALKEVREQHRNAERDLQRARELKKTASVTEKDFDVRATQERTLALRIPQSEAQVAILEADLAKKTVTAPFSGQIVREHTEVGEWLPRGGPVGTLVDISSVYVRLNVPERYVRYLEEGDELSVRVQAAGDDPFPGRVASISVDGDPDSRTFPARIEVANDGRLRSGMSARVDIPADVPQESLVVSKDAILLQGTESYVFIVGEGERAERRRVRTGASSGSSFAVLEGLTAGDRAIVRGNERIQPGAPLRIIGTGNTSGD